MEKQNIKTQMLIEDLMDEFNFVKCHDAIYKGRFNPPKRIRDLKNDAEKALLRVIEDLEDPNITDEERSKLSPAIQINSFYADGWWCPEEGIKLGLRFIFEEWNNYN
jgi:hypothetical protein